MIDILPTLIYYFLCRLVVSEPSLLCLDQSRNVATWESVRTLALRGDSSTTLLVTYGGIWAGIACFAVNAMADSWSSCTDTYDGRMMVDDSMMEVVEVSAAGGWVCHLRQEGWGKCVDDGKGLVDIVALSPRAGVLDLVLRDSGRVSDSSIFDLTFA